MQPVFFIALIHARLRQARRDAALAAELIGGRNLQHRVPVDRRIVVRRGGFVRRDDGGDAHALARLVPSVLALSTSP